VPKSSLAADSRAASTAASPPDASEGFARLVETAFGIARCLRPADQAAPLVQAAAIAAQRDGRRAGEDLQVWFLRALVRTHVQTSPGGARREGAPDLDDTPDLYLYARSAAAGLPIDGQDPAAALLDRMGTDGVVTAIARLAEEYRLVCSCYFLADLTYEEIALVLEYPVGALRARLHRGRRMLQKALWQVAQAEGITPLEGDARP
jgi:RNA polymerase sigma-70 factor (ECF subfamily)